MDLDNILKGKKEKGLQLKNKFSLPTKVKSIGLVKISNKTLIRDLRDAFLVLPASFVLQINGIKTETLGKNIIATGKIETKELIGFDFILCDEDIKDLNKYLSNGIVPIIPLENPFSSILQEFNPMRNEGNAYIFNKEDKRSIFYAIVRYIENSKFPFDNKNLVKNVLDV